GLYLFDAADGRARLVAASRPLPATLLPVSLEPDAAEPWPVAELIGSAAGQVVADLAAAGLEVTAPPLADQVKRALLLPLKESGSHSLSGFLLLGASPRRAFDDSYRAFLELIGAQVAAGLAETQAYQAERERAEALAEIDRAKTVFFSNVS